MNTPKLTSRQIETLRRIYDFVSLNGLSPTLNELRNAMGLASDQSVVEILQRLEDRGMIEKRVPGQARSLKLTQDAFLAIGAPPAPPAAHSGLLVAAESFGLSPHQQRIYKRLSDIDPKLARMYEGGLRVLLDASNPERIALSAHSIRESTYHLSNMGKVLLSKAEAKEASDKKVNNARQLERLFDPLGGARHFDRTVYDTWSRDFHDFFVEVSHHGQEVTLEEYCAKLAQFEDFLARYVLPLQTEIYARMDDQLARGPSGASDEDLRFLLSRNLESYRYFFRKADARWFSFLRKHSLLLSNWESADYLARIADLTGEEVMAVIESMTTTPDQWGTRKGFIDAAIKMPPAIARRLIQKIDHERWLTELNADWFAGPLNDLLGVFIDSGQHQDAMRLAALLLPGGDEPQRDLKSYHREQVLKTLLDVPVGELAPYTGLLVRSLAAAIAREQQGHENDRSFSWRSSVEDSDQNWHHGDAKDQIVTCLRNMLDRYVNHLRVTDVEKMAVVLDDLLKWAPPYSIFTRLKLHCYRQNADLFAREIETAVIQHFHEMNVWHEYFLLLKEQFPRLSREAQSSYLDRVAAGPQGEQDQSYIGHWQAHQLAPVTEHLSAEDTQRFRELLIEARKLPHPDFLTYHSAGWVGPTSPMNEADLEDMPVAEIVERLASWNPAKDEWFSSSREGLGRVLSAVVGKKAEPFSKEAFRFLDPRIRPVYVYHLLLGLQQGIKGGAQIDWPSIVTLAAAIVEHADTGTLSAFEADGKLDAWEVAWDGVFQEVGSVLENGMRRNDQGPDFASRDQIFRIIAFVCEHPNPTPEYEKTYGGKNMDPVTVSINTVRGAAFHALFAYIFWCDRHLGSKEANGSRIPQEAKDILEAHLNPARDPSLAVRSVYGQFFPWLFVFDKAWTKTLIERIFPANDEERRYAAWETYLYNSVFLEVYRALKPQYELAIAEARKFKPTRRYGVDPIERLADHMMVAYLFRAEDDKGAAWSKFFQRATPKQRGRAVNFAGRVYVIGAPARSGDMIPDKNRLQEFWEWRLNGSKDVEELVEFGWWVKDGYFDDKWMLERLIETLAKTDGAISADFYVFEALEKAAPTHPELCGRALSLIVKSRSTDRWAMADRKEIRSILTTVHGNSDPDIQKLAFNVIDHLTKLGFESYRTILENPPARLLPEPSAIVKGS